MDDDVFIKCMELLDKIEVELNRIADHCDHARMEKFLKDTNGERCKERLSLKKLI